VHAFGFAVPFGGVNQAGLLWRIREPQLHQDPPAETRFLNCAGESQGGELALQLPGSTGAATRIEYDLVDTPRPIQLERRAPVSGEVRIVGDEQQADLALPLELAPFEHVRLGVHLGDISLAVDEVGTTLMDGSAVEVFGSRDGEVAMTHTRCRSSWSRKIWVVLGLQLGRDGSKNVRNDARRRDAKTQAQQDFQRFRLGK